jgi:dihydrodipicolinate synthase/N-acetylneuraminate lyase
LAAPWGECSPSFATGEFTSLTPEEYRDVIRLNVEAAAGRIPIIAGIGSTSTSGAVDLARYAEKAGADALMVVPPFYDPLAFAAVKAFLRTVADSVGVQIVYYNVPGATGVRLDAEQLAELGEIDGVDYFKDTSGDAVTLTDVLTSKSDRITAFNGWDTLTFASLALGAKGAVWGTASILPAQAAELFRAVAIEKDLERGRACWAPLWRLSAVLESMNYPAGIKAALDILGTSVGPVRPPILPLTSEERSRIADALHFAGVI